MGLEEGGDFRVLLCIYTIHFSRSMWDLRERRNVEQKEAATADYRTRFQLFEVLGKVLRLDPRGTLSGS